MVSQWLGDTTFSVTEPGWDGSTFSDPDALSMWLECPGEVQALVLSESKSGNTPWSILRNTERGIILIALASPPRTPAPSAGFHVHTSFSNGNYRYDGTACTYEHIQSGFFIAFEDPDWEDSSGYSAP